jgi:large subunit ribosomal protein L10
VTAVGRREREEAVEVLARRVQKTKGLIVLDYKGLNVEKVTSLRKQIRQTGCEMKVAKNTLMKIATKDTVFEPLHEQLVGQMAVTFIDGDPAMVAKVITRFLKDNPDTPLKVKSGMLEKMMLNEKAIEQLGNLPSRDVLLAQLLGTIAAPLTGFVTVLSDIPRKFLRVLMAIKDTKSN